MPTSDLKSTARLHVFETPGSELKDSRRDTGQMAAPLKDEVLLSDVMREMVETRGLVQSLASTVVTIGQDVAYIKAERAAEKANPKTYSGAIRAVTGEVERGSKHNIEQDAAIAHVVTELATVKSDMAEVKSALAENNEMTAKVVSKVVDEAKGFMKDHPALGQALIGLAMAAIGAATMWLSGGHR